MKRISGSIFVITLILTINSAVSLAGDTFDTAPEEAGIFQGMIIEIVEHHLIVKKSDGEVVRVPMPGETGKRVADFRVE